MTSHHINPLQWHQALGYSRQSCARIFRDGGSPEDAMRLFGLAATQQRADWSKAVETIATILCSGRMRQAA